MCQTKSLLIFLWLILKLDTNVSGAKANRETLLSLTTLYYEDETDQLLGGEKVTPSVKDRGLV